MPDRPDDPAPWKVLASEYVSRKPWFTVRLDRVQLPTGAVIAEYWVSEFRPWVNVVAVTADVQVVLIRQYRHGLGQVHFEIPAGTRTTGTSRSAAVARTVRSSGASRIVSRTRARTLVSGRVSAYLAYAAAVVTSSCPEETASENPNARRHRSSVENTDPEWVTSATGPAGSGSGSA